MKVYFTCSTAELLKYSKNYFAIRNFIIKEKHLLVRDFLHRAHNRLKAGDVAIDDIKEIYKACIKGIDEADVVIVEDTVSNFSTGHQITIALQRQKPVLVLWCEPKHRHFKKTFIQGIESDYLEVAEYNLENYKEIIRKFVKKYEKARQKNRFNLVLSDIERKYLDWYQYNRNESRTKVIRKLIREAMNEDIEYNDYLSK